MSPACLAAGIPGSDATVLGWATAAAYAWAAWSCWRAAVRSTEPRPRAFWRALAACCGLLAVNKQLDGQSALVALLRGMAKEQGWYESRRSVQIAALAAGLAAIALLALILTRALRGHLRGLWPALAGLSLIAAYFALRMTSIHAIDDFTVRGAFPMKWWAEQAGLACIVWAGWRQGRGVDPPMIRP